jgi:hypothetical protein
MTTIRSGSTRRRARISPPLELASQLALPVGPRRSELRTPVSIDLRPAELSVRLPRLGGSMGASIQEGRRGGAISDG